LNSGSECGYVQLTESSGTIKSPGYGENRYANNAKCQWLISAASDEVKMILTFEIKS